MAMFSERILAETPELHDEGVRMRFIGRREGVDPRRCSSRWTGPRRRPAANDRITLFVAFNYGGRAEIVDAARALQRQRPRRSSARHLYAPEMHDPDLIIRTSGEQRLSQLPAVAVAPTPSSSSPTSCGPTSRARRSRRRWPSTTRRRRRFGGGADGATRGRAPAPARAGGAAAARRGAAARTSARACWSRSRRSPSRSSSSPRAAWSSRSACSRSASSACTSCSRCSSARARSSSPASSALAGLAAAALLRRPSARCCWRSSRSSRWCSCSRSRCRERAARRSPADGDHHARRRTGSGCAFAHAVLLRELPHGGGDRRRRPGRHVHRRHRRLPRRARASARGRWRRGSRPTRRSRGWSIGIVAAVVAHLWSPASTRTGSRHGDALLLGVGGRRSPRRSATSSSPTSSATRARRTPARLFGAHGGALDRLDAVLFTLVAGYYVWLAMLVTDDRAASERRRRPARDRPPVRAPATSCAVALPGRARFLFAFLLDGRRSPQRWASDVTPFQRDVLLSSP